MRHDDNSIDGDDEDDTVAASSYRRRYTSRSATAVSRSLVNVSIFAFNDTVDAR